MKEKETILSILNMRDYREELEAEIDNKAFDDEAKGLILNIFYKLDNFYKDYQEVKKDVEVKSQFLEDYILAVKDCCSEIKVLPPQEFDEENDKFFIDREKASIQCFPSENVILYAILSLAENKLKDETIGFTNKCIIDMLNKGKTVNDTEPIRDFNGWSWNIEIKENRHKDYNIIFQNFLILFGYDFVKQNMNQFDVKEKIYNRIKQYVSEDLAKRFINCIVKLAIALYNEDSAEKHNECLEYKETLKEKVEKLSNRKEYIKFISEKKEILLKQIEDVDKLLNDFNMIKNEFSSSVLNEENKYFCVSDVVDKKEAERKKLMKLLEENNRLLSPKEYLKILDGYRDELKLYDCINENGGNYDINSEIVELQLIFLECFRKKILNDENKKDINKFVYQLRYYNFIPFDQYEQITLEESISQKYKEVSESAIYVMINGKFTDLDFKNHEFCYNILKYLFSTKVMKLENIFLKMNFMEDNKVDVEYYDGDILDNQITLNFPINEDISNKKNRRIKLLK